MLPTQTAGEDRWTLRVRDRGSDLSAVRGAPWLLAAGLLFVADLVFHLPVTDVCDALAKRFGFAVYDEAARRGFLLLGVAALGAAWAWPSERRLVMGSATSVLLAAAFVAQQLLMVASIENIHFPQYALLAILLARGAGGLERAWMVTLALGAADEMYQRLTLLRGTPAYFDWNDVVLNGIGAAFGVVLCLAWGRPGIGRPAMTRTHMAATASLCLLGAALALDPPVLTPFLTMSPGGRRFHILSGFEAAVALLLLWAGIRHLLVRLTPAAPRNPAGITAADHTSRQAQRPDGRRPGFMGPSFTE